MKRGTPTHIKTKRLARALGIPRYAAVGIEECLFHLTAAQTHEGDIGRLDDAEIADEIGWIGDPATLIAGLVSTGWVDRCRCHRLRVHDWPDHADQTVARVLAKAKRSFLACYDDPSSVLASAQHETSEPDSTSVRLAGPPSLALPSQNQNEEAEAEEEKKPEAAAEPAAVVGPLESDPGELPSWGRLANLLGPHGSHPTPEPDEKAAWLASLWPEIVAASDAELPDDASAKQRGAARSRIALARWRVYLRGEREYIGAAELARCREKSARLSAEQAALPPRVYDLSLLKVERIG